MLKRDEPSFLSVGSFLELCSSWLDEKEMEELECLSLCPPDEDGPVLFSGEVSAFWNQWETCARNRIARQRASRTDKDAGVYLREEKDFYSEVDRGVQDAYSIQNPLEREKALDCLRWNMLDNLESGHFFDFEFLCVYKLKLMIREKWSSRKKEQGEANFSSVVDEILSVREGAA